MEGVRYRGGGQEPSLPSRKTGAIESLGYSVLNKVILVCEGTLLGPKQGHFRRSAGTVRLRLGGFLLTMKLGGVSAVRATLDI